MGDKELRNILKRLDALEKYKIEQERKKGIKMKKRIKELEDEIDSLKAKDAYNTALLKLYQSTKGSLW